MLCILFRKNDFLCWDMPVNAKRIIQDTDTTISLWMIELIVLILIYPLLGEIYYYSTITQL